MPLLLNVIKATQTIRLRKFVYQGMMALFFFTGLGVCNAETRYDEYGDSFNTALIAELYQQMGDPQLAVSHYIALALSINTPKVVKRATVIAARSSQLIKGKEMAEYWVELSPNDLEARQYFALLLLRNNEIEASANQLHFIYDLVEKEKNTSKKTGRLYSEGLKFIGAMLLIEAKHEKALRVFNTYLAMHNNSESLNDHQDQQLLVQASLAEKAKKHSAVITYINKYEEAHNEQLHDVTLMKVKALQKLSRINDAVQYLSSIIKAGNGKDSLKLELVRLLILNKERQKAEPFLEELVSKYPDNNDLLKSLIALEIDQKKLKKARKNIEVLKLTKDYINDADYFIAEVLEAEGDLKLALLKYKEVKGGSLLKSAKRKILRLTKVLNHKTEKTRVNFKKQKDDLPKEK